MRRCPENEGVERHELRRGDALLTPDQFHRTDVVDVRVHGDAVAFLPKSVMLHLGSAEESGRLRPLGADIARLTLAHPCCGSVIVACSATPDSITSAAVPPCSTWPHRR